MADVSVTATTVAPIANSTRLLQDITWGGTVTAGQPVYKDSSGTYQAADANSSATTAKAVGIAMTGGASGQSGVIAIGGTYTCGFTATAGAWYIVSATAGGIAPVADQTTGWIPCLVGYATTTAIVSIQIISTGITL